MSDIGKNALKTKIDAKIYDNESQLISGTILNEVLQDAVDTLADGGNLDEGSVDTANLKDKAVTKGKLEQNVSADLDWAVASNSYYRNSQAGNVAAKEITTYKNMSLIGGGSLKVTFEQANTADDATLNIDGKGAKPLYYNGKRVSSTNSWEANETVEIYYNNYNSGAYHAKRWMVEPVSVSQNIETGKTEILIGNTPALIVDNEPEVGSNNLVKSGGVLQSEYALVGIVAKTVKPNSGWYGSISGQRFNIVANKQYAIYNVGSSKAVTMRLYDANSEVVETKDINIEAGANSIVSFAHNAVEIDIYFNGTSNELDFYEVNSYRAEIDKLQQGLIQTDNNVGFISKVVKPSSGWYGSISGQRFNIVSGTEYYLSNAGESTAATIRLYNASDEVVETKDVNIAAGASAKVTFSHDAVEIDIYFAGSNNVLGFYIADSIGGELQDTKTKIPSLSDNLGDSDKTAPTQRLLKSQSNSIFEDYRTSGTGIVGFGVRRDFTQLPTVKKFRFNTYSFNNNVLYGDIQGLIGDEWTNLDSVNHTKGDDNIEIVESVYHRFFVIVNYSILLSTGSIYRDLDWQIRNSAVQFVTKEIFGKLKDLLGYVAIPSYELKDSSLVNIYVKKDGTGDFTTIGDAIASIGNATQRNESSSFEKQYCIRVFPGVYNEVNLFVPDYVHIYGLHPNTVIVTSVGLTTEEEPPVFDMYGNCKLSNMTIISAYGYCVHIDSGRDSRTCVCENLYCKKVYNATSLNPQGDDVRNNAWIGTYTNPSVIGMGMGINEYKFIFKNCTFENGWVAAHTNANNDSIPNTRIEYHNCKLVNAIIDLQTLDNSGGQFHTDGKYICVVDNIKTQRGRVSLRLDYFEDNSAWSVLGGCNDNFVPSFNNLDGASESWENLNTTEKSFIQLASGVSCTKGQFIDCDGNICTGSTPKDDIVGIALDAMSADSLDAVGVWIGNAFPITLTDGEYGIGADGKLSASATNKIGFVKSNIFYRY